MSMAGVEVATGELMNTRLGGPCSDTCSGRCKCPGGVGANLKVCPRWINNSDYIQTPPWLQDGEWEFA